MKGWRLIPVEKEMKCTIPQEQGSEGIQVIFVFGSLDFWGQHILKNEQYFSMLAFGGPETHQIHGPGAISNIQTNFWIEVYRVAYLGIWGYTLFKDCLLEAVPEIPKWKIQSFQTNMLGQKRTVFWVPWIPLATYDLVGLGCKVLTTGLLRLRKSGVKGFTPGLQTCWTHWWPWRAQHKDDIFLCFDSKNHVSKWSQIQ